MKRFTFLEIVSGCLAIMLIIGLCNMPYGFYTLLRIVTTVVMSCFVYRFLSDHRTSLAIICGTIALIFQPFIKVVLDKTTWHFVDVLVAISLIIFVLANHIKK